MQNGRKYTIGLKVEAVKLVKKSGKPIAKIARVLNISPSGLGRWIKEYDKLKKSPGKKEVLNKPYASS